MEPQTIENQPTNITNSDTVSHVTASQPLPEIIGTQKKFPWLVVIFATLFAATLAAGTFFFLRMQSLQKQLTFAPSPTPIASPTPSADPTAGWQTYKNSSAKYLIKYPPLWKVEDYGLMDPQPATSTTKNVRFSYQPDISQSSIGLDIEESPVVNVSQDIVFDKEKLIGSSLAKCGNTKDLKTSFCWLRVPNKDSFLIFVIQNYSDNVNNLIVNQILSTFRFTNE